MADVTLPITSRIHNQFGLLIEESKEWESLAFAPDFLEHRYSTGVLKLLILLVFANDKFCDREVFLEERFDFLGLDKLIELAAPPSPGCVEEQKDILMSGDRVGLGFTKNFISGRRGYGREGDQGE